MAMSLVSCRYIFAFMGHVGFIVLYGLRVNLSVALVAMVNSTYAMKGSSDSECKVHQNRTVTYNGGNFNWDQVQQGYILSSFYYGYLVTQIPGGYLAGRYGGKWVYGMGVLLTGVLTLLTPICARWGLEALILVRVLEGLTEGVTVPAMLELISQWSPPKDITKYALIVYSGVHSGTVVTLPISGFLCNSKFLGGWPSAFYISGGVSVIWFVFWSFLIESRPQNHRFISDAEKSSIEACRDSRSAQEKVSHVPWFSILSSVPVWAIVVGTFCNSWVGYMILTGLPFYFQQVLGFDLKKNGLLSALPFLISFVTMISSGVVCDYAIRRGLSKTAARRLFSLLGFLPCSAFLILESYTRCDEISLSVLYLVLSSGILSVSAAGYSINHLDIAPRFSGVLMGMSNSAGTVAGCLSPLVTGYFTEHNPSRGQYRVVFVVAAGLSAFGGLSQVFSSGVEQPWSKAGSSVADVEDKKRLLYVDQNGQDEDSINFQ